MPALTEPEACRLMPSAARRRLLDEETAGGEFMWPPTLAAYGPMFRRYRNDHMFSFRLLCSEFGQRWRNTPAVDKPGLVATEPALVHPGWDAFLAGWVHHHCHHDDLAVPEWVHHPERVYHGFWTYIPPDWTHEIAEAMVHSPAAFAAHGVWVARRDLAVV